MKMRAWERARKLARNPSRGGRIRSEFRIRLGTESATDSESDIDVDSETLKDLIAKKDSDAGMGACSEARSESESRRSDSVRAQNQARYGIGNGFRVGRRRRSRGSQRLDSKERCKYGHGSALKSSLGIRFAEVGFDPISESDMVGNRRLMRVEFVNDLRAPRGIGSRKGFRSGHGSVLKIRLGQSWGRT